MNRIKNKIIEITSSLVWVLMLVIAMFSFASLAQAETVSDSVPFDHTKTGFVLRDIHTTLKCEQCHVGGVFKNTPKDCAGCHSIGSRVGATAKPANHIVTTFACDVCHESPTSFLVKSYKHFGVINGCATCHGAGSGQSIGVVKINPAIHIVTNLSCETCHTNTSTFLSANMNHVGIMGNCASCHSATGVPIYPGVVNQPAVGHITYPVGTDCGTCHRSFSTFLGAFFDHTTVVAAGNCNSCHTGQFAGVKGYSTNHIPPAPAATMQCDACHTVTNTIAYTTFLGVTYHNGATPVPGALCSTCHDGTRAGVQGTSFYPPHKIITPGTVPACDTCHNVNNTGGYVTFLGATFDSPAHVAAGVVSPGSPTGSLACATCHNGTTAQTFVQPHVTVNTSTTSCASCHTNSLTTMSWLGASFIHPSPIGVAGGPSCASCHNGTLAATWVAPHVATTSATVCDSCHTTTATSGFVNWLGATFNHTAAGISSTKATSGSNQCAGCHNGSTAQTYVPPHATTNSATACDSCHTTTAAGGYVNWLGATFNHATNVPPITSTKLIGTTIPACAACHNGTAAQTFVQPHVIVNTATTACDTCHTTVASSGFVNWLGATFNHATVAGIGGTTGTTGNGPSCVSCHNGTNAATWVAPHVATTTSTQCETCHAASQPGYVNWLGAVFNHSTVANIGGTTGTTGVGPSCVSCHNGTNAATWVAPHVATTTSTQCETCHAASQPGYVNWLGAVFNHAANVPPITSTKMIGTTIPACAACHNGTTAQTYVQPHVVVNTATTACDSCHTTAAPTFANWLGATFTHPTSVISPSAFPPPDANACGTCHNGSTASTFVAPHAGAFASATMTAASKCDDCHTNALTSLSWTGMTLTVAGLSGTGTFVHTDVTGYPGTGCASCHTGAFAQGKPTSHVVTAAACDSCHTTALTSTSLSWLGAVGVVHTTGTTSMTAGGVTVAGATNHCSSCHNGTIAKGISAGHIPTSTLNCDAGGTGCHAVNLPAALTFAPGSMSTYEHGLVITTCTICHSGAYATQGITLGGAVGKVSNHIPTTITGSKDCTTCHIPGFVATAGAAGWAGGEKMDHNSATGGVTGSRCTDCHLSGGVAYLGTAQKKSHNGASATVDCSSSKCHAPLGKTGSAYTKWN